MIRGGVIACSTIAALAVMASPVHYPATGQLALDDRQDQDDEEQQEREGRAVAVAVELVELVEDQDARGRRRVAGPALRHDVDMIERLEGSDDGKDEQEVGGWGEEGQGDVAEERPAARAVDSGRLVQLARNSAEAGQENRHIVAGEDPGGEDDQGDQREARAAGPVRKLEAEMPADQGENSGRLGQPALGREAEG